MKYLLCMAALLLAGGHLAAQETVLTGTLGFAGGESFTYELHLSEAANGTLSGYSLLYATPGRETRATLVGLINREEKTLSFAEQSIEYSRNFESRAYICRLSARLTYHPFASAGRPGLFGSTGTNEYNDNRCSSGTLSFSASDALRKLFALTPPPAPLVTRADTPVTIGNANALPQPLPATVIINATQPNVLKQEEQQAAPAAEATLTQPSIENMPANQQPSPRTYYFPKEEKKEEVQQPEAQKTSAQQPEQSLAEIPGTEAPAAEKQTLPVVPEQPRPPKITDTTGGLHLTDMEAADITVNSDVLEVSVFKGGSVIDGDEITLMYNERTLLNHFKLRAGAQILRLPVDKGGRMRILALSEGTEKPCVAAIHIRDGDQLHRFIISNEAGKESAILIHKAGQP